MDALDLMNPKAKNALSYMVTHNDVECGPYLGKRLNNQGKDIIDFINIPENIQTGDHITETQTKSKYIVTDIDFKNNPCKSFLKNHYAYYHVYIIPKIQQTLSNGNTYNITAQQSIVTLNSQNVAITANFTDLQSSIDKECTQEDKIIGYELLSLLKNMQKLQKPIKRNFLQKFGDFLSKYSSIAIAVGQILVQLFTQ